MSLRIFSVLSQNLLRKKKSKRNERIWCKGEVIWGEAEKKRTKCSSVSNAKLTLSARVLWGMRFLFCFTKEL